PDVAFAGAMLAEKAVVAEAVNEKSIVLDGGVHRALFVRVAKKRRGDREIRIYGVAQRHALAFNRRVVVAYPLARLLRADERECQRAQAEPRCVQDRFAPRARHPEWRM